MVVNISIQGTVNTIPTPHSSHLCKTITHVKRSLGSSLVGDSHAVLIGLVVVVFKCLLIC